jgi:hypothetical protein
VRRPLAIAVALCFVGSAVALYAATRPWEEIMTHRIEPFPPYTDISTGNELFPGLTAIAVVGLAGAGAVLATKGVGRRLVGVLLTLVGLGVVACAVVGIGKGSPTWPVTALLGGLAVVAGGLWVGASGHRWPHMGARYDRTESRGRTGSNDAWDALDRGEDPTVR